MNIIDFLKEQKKWTVSKYKLWKAYHSDYEEYNHWQYHNPNVKTQNALEAKILRQTHVIEKGMSLSHPREKFGVQKALELLDFIDEFVECGWWNFYNGFGRSSTLLWHSKLCFTEWRV